MLDQMSAFPVSHSSQLWLAISGLSNCLPSQSSRLLSSLSFIYINNKNFSCCAQSEIFFSETIYGVKLLFIVKWSSSHWLIVFVYPDNIKHVSQIICSEPAQKIFDFIWCTSCQNLHILILARCRVFGHKDLRKKICLIHSPNILPAITLRNILIFNISLIV